MTICPYCAIEVSESAIEAEDGCCPECGSVITMKSDFMAGDDDYDDVETFEEEDDFAEDDDFDDGFDEIDDFDEDFEDFDDDEDFDDK